MIQPYMLSTGWIEKRDGDESCRTIFDRHYSRHVYAAGRKSKLFVGPGTKKVLMLADGRGVVRVAETHQRRRTNRRELRHLARERWWPTERFYTYVSE